MIYQKEQPMNGERKAFEEVFPIPAHWIEYDEKRNKYYCPYVADAKADEYQARWESWQASAQRQGYKLVPVEPTIKMSVAYAKNSIAPNSGLSFSGYKAMIGAVDEK